MMDVSVLPDAEALAAHAARWVAEAAHRAVSASGAFSLVLSGGSTPRALYEMLARPPYLESVDWSRTDIFFGDERCVPPDDAASNYRTARLALLDHAPVPAEALHRIPGELPPDRAAALYEADIRNHAGGGTPHFDLVLLGMGTDGHTASLFPGSPVLKETRRLVAAAEAPAEPRHRITLTLPVLNAARDILVLVTGEEKAAAFARVMQERKGENRPILPAALLDPAHGRLRWLLDRSAAALCEKRPG